MRKNTKLLTVILVVFMISSLFGYSNVSIASEETTSGQQELPALTKGPYIQDVRMNSAVIMWETTRDEEGEVQYGYAPGSYVGTVKAESYSDTYDVGPDTGTYVAGVRYHYKATIRGLTPNTRVYYKVKSGNYIENEFSFKTAVDAHTPFNFLVWGDTQSFLANSVFIDEFNALKEKPDFMLHVGDITSSEPERMEYWQSFFFDPYKEILKNNPLFTLPGNHDTNLFEEHPERYYQNFFSPPEDNYPNREYAKMNYAFTYGDTFFVTLDGVQKSTEDRSFSGGNYISRAQRNWLNEVLKSPEALRAKHRIVAYHEYTGKDPRDGFENVLATVKGNDVALILNGHSHNYRFDEFKGQKFIVTGLWYAGDENNSGKLGGKPSYVLFNSDPAAGKLTMNSYAINTLLEPPYKFEHADTYEFTNSYDPDTQTRVALQQGVAGYFGAKDTYIMKDRPAADFGASRFMRIKGSGKDSSMGMLKFDLSSLPKGAKIESAVLKMFPEYSSKAKGESNISIHKTLTDVNFGSSHGLDTKGASTWGYKSYPSTRWATGKTGGLKAGTDYEAEPIGAEKVKLPIRKPQDDGVISGSDWNCMQFDITSTVQSWIDNPDENLGLTIKAAGTDKSSSYIYLASSNGDTGHKSLRPALWITYKTPEN